MKDMRATTPPGQAYNDAIGDASQRGNCSYAHSVKRRIDYINLCSSFNNPDGWSGLMQVCARGRHTKQVKQQDS
jgi:hypothetical protein